MVKALYDYDATAPGELSVKEDDVLLAFDAEDGWLLVQTEKGGGKAGFVPENYVEVDSHPFFSCLCALVILTNLLMLGY